MKKFGRTTVTGSLLLAFILPGVILCCFGSANAEEPAPYNLKISLKQNLLLLKGRYVRVNLVSGQTIAGYVKDVNKGFLHLEKISERNYYDALILVRDISAIEAQFRGLKR